MIILAYIIVVVVSQFMLTAGVLVTVLLGFLLTWLPERIRVPLLGFVGGVAGALLAVFAARLVFSWLAGRGSFGWGPFLAATVPLAIPILNDYRKHKALQQIQGEAPAGLAEITAPTTAAIGAMPLGAVAGIVLGAVLLM